MFSPQNWTQKQAIYYFFLTAAIGITINSLTLKGLVIMALVLTTIFILGKLIKRKVPANA